MPRTNKQSMPASKPTFLQRFRELPINKTVITSNAAHGIVCGTSALDALTLIAAIELYCKTLKEELRPLALVRAKELVTNGINVLPSGVKFSVKKSKKYSYENDSEHAAISTKIAELEQQRKNREKILQLQGLQPLEESETLAITLPD